tara:strand:+ start:1874 stop:2212 length:339 start_codon:yes stop_codon:yes gene_type:complete
MKELRQKLQTLLSNSIGDRSASDYKKLITFIDASISQAFKLPEEEKNSFLISSVLNIRDYLQSEIVTMTITSDARTKVLQICDDHIKSDFDEFDTDEWSQSSEEGLQQIKGE